MLNERITVQNMGSELSGPSLERRKMYRYVWNTLNRNIPYVHVKSVVNILFSELLNDLIKGKKIKIYNFGTLSLVDLAPKNYFDIWRQKMMLSKKYKKMSFVLFPKIRNFICDHLDLDLTFGKDYNETPKT